MKILRLELHNIASFGDAVLDFSSGPLADSGLFLISGITGAGKSTILDGICLALYGTTPRIAQGLRTDKLELGGESLNGGDTRMMLRHGTAEGWARLTFEGNDSHIYLCEWSMHTARRKVGSRPMRPVRTMTDLTAGESIAPKEIIPRILEVVGLDFTQFCRTTMLAQGEFTRFLKASEKDKSEILEKITRTEIFGLVGHRITLHYRECEEAVKQKARELEMTGGLSEEDVAQARERHDGLMKRRTEISRLRQQILDKIDWYRQKAVLTGRIVTAARNRTAAIAALKAPEAIALRELLELHRLSAPLRNDIARRRETTQAIDRIDSRLRDINGDYRSLYAENHRLNCHTLSMLRRLSHIDSRLSEMQQLGTIADTASALVADLRTLQEMRNAVGTCRTEIEKGTNAMEHNRAASQLASDRAKSAEKALDDANSRLDDLRTRLDALVPEETRKIQLDIVSRQAGVSNAVAALERLTQARHAVEARRKALDDDSANHLALSTQLEALSAQRDAAASALEALEETYRTQKALVTDWLKEERSKLHAGDTCPLCGQTVKADPDNGRYESLLAVAESRRDAAANAHASLMQRHAELSARAAALKSAIEREKGLLAADTTVAAAEATAREAMYAVGVDPALPAPEESLRRLGMALDQKLSQLRPRLGSISALEKEIAQADREGRELQRALDRTRKEAQQATAELVRSESALEASRLLYQRESARLNTLTARIKESAAAGIYPDWDMSPLAAADSLERDLEQYRSLIAERGTLATEIAAARTADATLEDARRRVARRLGIADESEDMTCDNSGTAPDARRLGERWTQLESELAGLQTRREALMADIEKCDIRIAEWYAEKGYSEAQVAPVLNLDNAEIQRMEHESARLADEATATEGVLADARAAYLSHLDHHPGCGADENVDTLKASEGVLSTEFDSINTELGAIDEKLRRARAEQEQRHRLETELAALRDNQARWQRLYDCFGTNEGTRFRRIALSYVLDTVVSGANRYLRTLAPRYTLLVTSGEYTIQVADSYNAGARRFVSNLSGGEIFLVSLAMALSLADMGDCLGVDTLFIDEGFGSLSADECRGAIDTLSRLRMRTGRTVGIISHVAALRESIPVQVVVRAGRAGSPSTLEVVTL